MVDAPKLTAKDWMREMRRLIDMLQGIHGHTARVKHIHTIFQCARRGRAFWTPTYVRVQKETLQRLRRESIEQCSGCKYCTRLKGMAVCSLQSANQVV